MKKIKTPPPPPGWAEENGLETIRAIIKDQNRYHVYTTKLKDGDEISLIGYQAEGIMMILESLSVQNRKRMERMDLLELIHVYDQAITEGVMKEPKLATLIRDRVD
jgi:hypothetical protein